MGSLAADEVLDFLNRLGAQYQEPVTLYLLGGGALCLLGSPRRTMDIDCTLDSTKDVSVDFIQTLESLADAMRLEVEIIPIDEFVPVPAGAEQRHQLVGRFGAIDVFIYDPYTIALSKLARGLESDLQDVIFLLDKGIIQLSALSAYVDTALPVAWHHDVDPADLRHYLAEVRRLVAQG